MLKQIVIPFLGIVSSLAMVTMARPQVTTFAVSDDSKALCFEVSNTNQVLVDGEAVNGNSGCVSLERSNETKVHTLDAYGLFSLLKEHREISISPTPDPFCDTYMQILKVTGVNAPTCK
jgi:hypothetical protein